MRGKTATFSLSGISQNEYIEFYANGVDLGAAYGYPTQTMIKTLVMYEVGKILITAVGLTSGLSDSMYVNVIDPTSLDPVVAAIASSFTAGNTATISASRFKANETVKFYVNNTEIAQQTANAAGSCSAAYNITANGAYVFSATGMTSGLTAVYSVAGISGALGVSLGGNPRPGDTIQANITGAYTTTSCAVYLDGRSIGGLGSSAHRLYSVTRSPTRRRREIIA